MNSSLLERIEELSDTVLATILATEGHTYKKRGAKALYVEGSPFPAWGNLGVPCVDPQIIEAGAKARSEGRPTQVVVDTSDPADAYFGTGTACGGRVTLLIEPVPDHHKKIYREVRQRLERGDPATLVHDLATGELTVTSAAPSTDEGHFVETFTPPRRLCILGATPLAAHIVRLLDDVEFSIHITDWREGYLGALKGLAGVTLHTTDWPVDSGSFALVVSHSHDRDLEGLSAALTAGCPFIGLLSSRTRRDHIFTQLEEEGFTAKQMAVIQSPVGILINSRSDAEIAISIAAQLIEAKNA